LWAEPAELDARSVATHVRSIGGKPGFVSFSAHASRRHHSFRTASSKIAHDAELSDPPDKAVRPSECWVYLRCGDRGAKLQMTTAGGQAR
jgi:hypothetical protein